MIDLKLGKNTRFKEKIILNFIKAIVAAIIILIGAVIYDFSAGGNTIASAKSFNNFAETVTNLKNEVTNNYAVTERETERAGNRATLITNRSAMASAPQSNIVARWKFDEGAGNATEDFTGNGSNGALINSPVWSPGRIQNALSFDGTDDKVTISNPSTNLTSVANNFTVAFWAYPTATHEIDPESTGVVSGDSGQRYAIFPPWGGYSDSGAGVSVGTNGVSVYEHGASYLPALLVYETPITGWTHIAIVYENKQPRLYLNGILVRTGLASPRSNVLINVSEIGGGDYGYFAGRLDDMRVYDSVLTASEINAIIAEAPPAMPTALSGTAVSSSQINLTWVDNSNDETNYIVQRRGENGIYADIVTLGANSTTYNNTGLASGASYYYRVRAYNANGNSQYSNEVNITTLPGSGTGLRGQYFDNADFTDLKLTRLDPTINFNWNSGSPDPSIVNETFSIRWTGQIEPRYSETYTFYSYHDDNVALWINGVLVINDGCCGVISGTIALTAGQKYDIRIEYLQATGLDSINLLWESQNQSLELVPSSELYPAPIAPTALSVTAASSSQINLTWTDNSNDEIGYKVERKTGAGGTFAEIATLGANATTYYNSGLSSSTAYYYRVRAYNANGNSEYSNEVYRMIQAITGTGTGLLGQYFDNVNFTNVKVTRVDPTIYFNWGIGSPDPSIDGETFSIRWTGQIEPLYSETYTFYVGHDDNAALWVNGVLLFDQGCCAESSNTIQLTAGQKYDIRIDYQEQYIAANVSLAWSSPSLAKEVVPTTQLYPTLIITPNNLVATAVSATQINLAWADNSDNENGFKIERKTGAAGIFAEIASTGANTTNFSDTTITTSTVYYYRVRAYNFNANSAYSNETTDIANSGTGLLGQYFDNDDFTNLKLTRVDPTVNFNWGNGSPDPSIDVDNFSVRWTGQVEALYSETYTFYVGHDDNAALWVNGVLLFDQGCCAESSNTIQLTAGQKYDIRIDYRESGGGATAYLSWSSPSQIKEIITAARLYPNVAPTVSITAPANQSSFNTGSNININAAAADSNGSITKVEFYQNNILLGEDASAPYSFIWSNASQGNYALTAVATDNNGAAVTSAPITIEVSDDNGTFVSQSVPAVMTAGATYAVSVTMHNSGLSSWTSDDINPSSPFRLGADNPRDNTTWGSNRTSLPNATTVAPGQDFTFTFNIIAPTTAGTYNFRRQMAHDPIRWFGDSTPNVVVTVGSAPISYWHLNEGSGTFAADSVGSNNGTLVNSPAWSPAGINNSLRFDGVDDFVQASTVNLPVGNADRSLSAWFRVNSFDGGESFIAGYGNFGVNDQAYLIIVEPGTHQIVFGQWGDSIYGPVVQTDRWYHVVATNIGNTGYLYLDGVLAGSKAMTINTASNSNFNIGRINSSLGDGRKLNGFVDEVQVYNRALNDGEVKELANTGTPVNPPSVSLAKAVLPAGTQQPGTDLTFTTTFTNTGGLTANSLTITDPMPANTDFKLSSVTSNLGTTGLTLSVTYSSDNAATWSYTPVSEGGGASAGYDRSVTNVRYTFAGGLAQTAPNNAGTISFIAKIR